MKMLMLMISFIFVLFVDSEGLSEVCDVKIIC